jgi:hypothetical protein
VNRYNVPTVDLRDWVESADAVNFLASWRSRTRPMQSVKGLSMEKGLCWGSLIVAGLMLLLFILDLIVGKPFGGSDLAGMQMVDIFGILASAVLGYLSWNALQDLR